MKRVVITGYIDRRDGPSAFIKSISDGLSPNYEITHIGSSVSFSDLSHLIRAEVFLFNSNNLMPIVIFPLKLMFPKRRFISIFSWPNGTEYEARLKKVATTNMRVGDASLVRRRCFCFKYATK